MTLLDQIQKDAAESRAIAARFRTQAAEFRAMAAAHDQNADHETGARRKMSEAQAASMRQHASIAERDAERWDMYAQRLEGVK